MERVAGETSTVLFDGDCSLCGGAVRFVRERDRVSRFRFAPLRSPGARELIARHGLDPDSLDSLVLLEDGRVYSFSDAALRIAGWLRRPWNWLAALLVLPAPLRDAAYRLIARNRYRLFGQRADCRLPRYGVTIPDRASRPDGP